MKTIIDLYLISGFLGSGKTTFLKQMLEQVIDRKVGVIVNEFGSVGIDGKILQKDDVKMVEINNGSIFCACLKGGFVKTLVAFLEQPIEVLFVEASGMADPSSMKQLLEQLTVLLECRPEISRQYDYKGSVCLIDALNFEECCEIFQPTINQVKKSSLIILNKMDEVSSNKLAQLHIDLTDMNPSAYIYDTVYGKVPLEVLKSNIRPNGVLEEESTNTVWNRPVTYILQMKDYYDLKKMKEFAAKMSEHLFRLKGFFKIPGGELAHADCVGDFIRIEPIEMDENKAECCEFVMIRKNTEAFEEVLQENWNMYFADKSIVYERE